MAAASSEAAPQVLDRIQLAFSTRPPKRRRSSLQNKCELYALSYRSYLLTLVFVPCCISALNAGWLWFGQQHIVSTSPAFAAAMSRVSMSSFAVQSFAQNANAKCVVRDCSGSNLEGRYFCCSSSASRRPVFIPTFLLRELIVFCCRVCLHTLLVICKMVVLDIEAMARRWR